ncbi:MAG: T9SS type A sorting domain-containing protein [Bacteroidales bacterium]|nr:T9SS type A sorting domain-containing protein [Bacteroidales bacterium]
MKISVLTILLLVFFLQKVESQLPPSSFGFIDRSDVYARLHSGGDHFNDHNGNPFFETPKGSGHHTISFFGLWVGGLDVNEQLAIGAQIWAQGTDFYTGPLTNDGLGLCDEETSSVWDRVNELSRAEIIDHLGSYLLPGYEPIDAIADWPAHGDPDKNQDWIIAPFKDVDNDLSYIPENGDYPLIRGDKCYFYVINDNANIHTLTNGSEVGVEVRCIVYYFECPEDSAFQHSIFFNYKIMNRIEGRNLHDAYISFYADFSIGDVADDYVGCDTTLNAVFGYNALPNDSEYGEHPPAQGICFLDHAPNRVMYFNKNGEIALTDPEVAPEFYNYMRNVWRDNTLLVVGGNGHYSQGGTDPAHFVFPGDLHQADEWSEVSAGNNAGDRQIIASFGPVNMEYGDEREFNFCLTYARDYEGDHIGSVDLLKERMERIRYFYDNDSTPCTTSWTNINTRSKTDDRLRLYPNPAERFITMTTDMNFIEAKFKIFDYYGKAVASGTVTQENKQRISIDYLENGLYLMVIQYKDISICRKFVKQGS